MNDLRILRDRQTAACTTLDRSGSQDPYGIRGDGRDHDDRDDLPDGGGRFYACNPVLLTGSDAEGRHRHSQPTRRRSFYALIWDPRSRRTGRTWSVTRSAAGGASVTMVNQFLRPPHWLQ